MGITVVLPTHPYRIHNGMTKRAVESVFSQTHPASSLIVENDVEKTGAAETRHRALMKATTEWVAFLDSDDQLLPDHLKTLIEAAEEHQADYVYSWFHTWNCVDPFPQWFGQPWDNDNPHATTITTLVRTEIAQQVGFLDYAKGPNVPVSDEDHRFTLGCMRAGAKIVHVPERTWIWNHHGDNTAGLPNRGDAVRTWKSR